MIVLKAKMNKILANVPAVSRFLWMKRRPNDLLIFYTNYRGPQVLLGVLEPPVVLPPKISKNRSLKGLHYNG